jgi:flagellin
MPVINTNTNAQYAQDALKINAKATANVMQQLSTGSRINAARDDAAGLSLSQNMTSQVRGLNQAVRNVNDGINLLQTADGALIETSNMLQRMRELAVQSANSTNSVSQRAYLNNEYSSLKDEITRIANNTLWNNASVFGASAAATTLIFQAGMNSGQTISITISAMDSFNLGVNSTAITSWTSSSSALSLIDTAMEAVNAARSGMGATMNQLSYSADNMVNISTNIAASRSTITDTDYATASAQLAKNQIISQAATAMLAQANQQPQSVLSLLKG